MCIRDRTCARWRSVCYAAKKQNIGSGYYFISAMALFFSKPHTFNETDKSNPNILFSAFLHTENNLQCFHLRHIYDDTANTMKRE